MKGGFMSIWNQVKHVLLTGICATSMLWPYEAEAARAYDNKTISRRAKRKPSSKKNTPPPKKLSPDTNVPFNAQDPQKTLNGLLKNIQDSETLSPEHKEAISLCLKELSKTQTGRYIFRNIPETIKTRIMPSGSGVLASYGGKTLSIAEGLFKNILNPKLA